jgi:hypothetical protein
MFRLALLLAVLAAACGSLTADQRAAVANVQVVNAEPAAECQNLGAVSGSVADARGIRWKAVVLGANTVHLDGPSTGTAFYCPPPQAPRALPAIVHP